MKHHVHMHTNNHQSVKLDVNAITNNIPQYINFFSKIIKFNA